MLSPITYIINIKSMDNIFFFFVMRANALTSMKYLSFDPTSIKSMNDIFFFL